MPPYPSQGSGSVDRIHRLIQATLQDKKTERMLLLSEGDAQVALDEAWDVLGSSSASLSPPSRIILRRICLKLAQTYDILPSLIFLRNVVRLEDDCRHGGASADVYYAKMGKDFVALKKLRVFLSSTRKQKEKIRKDLYRESLLWKGLFHPNVLPFLGVSDIFPGMISMVLPWMPKTIKEHREDLKDDGSLSDPEQFKEIVHGWLHQIALGLEYLHEEGVVHGDLHGGNILVDEDGKPRLTDFGMALIADATPFGYASIHGGGAVDWTALELLGHTESGSTRPTRSSDVWSFGCVCIELYTGEKPFPHLAEFQVAAYVLEGHRPPRPSLPGGEPMNDSLWRLIKSCWARKPLSRPSFSKVSQKLSEFIASRSPSPDPFSMVALSPAEDQPMQRQRQLFKDYAHSDTAFSLSRERSASPKRKSSLFTPPSTPPRARMRPEAAVKSEDDDEDYEYVTVPKEVHPSHVDASKDEYPFVSRSDFNIRQQNAPYGMGTRFVDTQDMVAPPKNKLRFEGIAAGRTPAANVIPAVVLHPTRMTTTAPTTQPARPNLPAKTRTPSPLLTLPPHPTGTRTPSPLSNATLQVPVRVAWEAASSGSDDESPFVPSPTTKPTFSVPQTPRRSPLRGSAPADFQSQMKAVLAHGLEAQHRRSRSVTTKSIPPTPAILHSNPEHNICRHEWVPQSGRNVCYVCYQSNLLAPFPSAADDPYTPM